MQEIFTVASIFAGTAFLAVVDRLTIPPELPESNGEYFPAYVERPKNPHDTQVFFNKALGENEVWSEADQAWIPYSKIRVMEKYFGDWSLELAEGEAKYVLEIEFRFNTIDHERKYLKNRKYTPQDPHHLEIYREKRGGGKSYIWCGIRKAWFDYEPRGRFYEEYLVATYVV